MRLATMVIGAGCLAAAGSLSCTDAGDAGTSATEQTLGACPTTTTNINQSLVVTAATHPGLTSRFTFARVMQKILDTGGTTSGQTKLTVYQQWFNTFAQPACSAAGIDPNGYGVDCPRPAETLLAGVDPYSPTGTAPFTALALFNRFDLTPQSGETCGEHRIVFAVPTTPAANLDRAFIIFEAALPNPQPALGVDGCYPVTRFWQSLSGLSTTARLDALEAFYFDGIREPITGVRIGPVVTAQNYGLAIRSDVVIGPGDPIPVPTVPTEEARFAPATTQDLAGRALTDHPAGDGTVLRYGGTSRFGQIRTNMFVNRAEWNLREFKLLSDCRNVTTRGCALSVEHVTVAANPADELFLDGHARSAKFQAEFLGQVGDLAGAATANDIGLSTADQHNEFESVQLDDRVDYGAVGHASTGFRAAITSTLASISSPITTTQVLDRAKSQTCAGCHLRSNGDQLGGGITWPADAGFVHITETGFLSDALTGTFLPRRKIVLDKFIAQHCDGLTPGPGPIDEERTVSGRPVGAAN